MNNLHRSDNELEIFFHPLVKRMITELYNDGYKKILDIGTGHGAIAQKISKHGRIVFAVDNCVLKIREAARENANDKERIKWALMDCEDLALKDRSINAVVSRSVLQYTQNQKVLSELKRVLSENGKIVLIENLKYNPFSWSFRIARRLGMKDASSGLRIISHLSLKDIDSFKEKFGMVYHQEYYLFSIVSLFWFLGIRNGVLFRKSFTILFKVDEWLLRKVPFLKRFCWMSFIVCQ